AAMTLLPVTVKAAPDDGVWRLGWVEAPISYNQVEPETFEGSSAGRYSLFSYGTLYCASRPAGCYAEGLAKFRLSPKVRGLMAGTAPGPGQMALRDIPSSWRDSRILARPVPVPRARADGVAGHPLQLARQPDPGASRPGPPGAVPRPGDGGDAGRAGPGAPHRTAGLRHRGPTDRRAPARQGPERHPPDRGVGGQPAQSGPAPALPGAHLPLQLRGPALLGDLAGHGAEGGRAATHPGGGPGAAGSRRGVRPDGQMSGSSGGRTGRSPFESSSMAGGRLLPPVASGGNRTSRPSCRTRGGNRGCFEGAKA